MSDKFHVQVVIYSLFKKENFFKKKDHQSEVLDITGEGFRQATMNL